MSIIEESVDVTEELSDWLSENWSTDLTVGEWWERLGMAGWSQPLLPADRYGRGLSTSDAMAVRRTITSFGALGAPMGLGPMLAAPTIASHGSREQIDRFIPDIVTGRVVWCQLFSEPGAGSDLAGLTTRAMRDGDSWVVNGQKVWTSGGNMADMGMLLARTNVDVPKHQGISWFAFSMRQDGVEVRPLREMTNNTRFCEVFMTDALVADDCRVGDANDGWRVANTTLAYERASMGAGGGGMPTRSEAIAYAGGRAGVLDRPVRDFVGEAPKMRATPGARPASPAQGLMDLARARGKSSDALVRQDLVRLYVYGELARLNSLRVRAARTSGADIPGMANLTKLAMADSVRLSRDLGLRILGARGTLHGYDNEGREQLATASPVRGADEVTSQALGAQAFPIFGGTDQVQRNIVSERVLGLPKDPGDMSHVPFKDLRKNG
jgi:alkylation response protein AidB-like acyl-CoA dehydrogenase